MVLSHRFKFIFIKTGKTAGTSIEVFFSGVCGPEDILTPFSTPEPGHLPRNYRGLFNPIRELSVRLFGLEQRRVGRIRPTMEDFLSRRKFFHHIPAWQVQARTSPRIWDRYFRFCVERNPWDKVVSGWHWYNYKYGLSVSMEDYLALCAKRIAARDAGVGAFPVNYLNYTHPITGEMLVDRVLRYENLDLEFNEVLAQLGIPAEGALSVRAKSGLRASGRRYNEEFSARQRRVVAELFEDEIRVHGYTFDD